MPHYQPEHKAAVDALLLGLPGVTTGQMFGHPSYKIAGKVFASLMENGIILKLPQATVNDLLKRENVTSFAPGGTPMRLWVLIEMSGADEYAQYMAYYQEAWEFVASESEKSKK
jgi:hypothetical protein